VRQKRALIGEAALLAAGVFAVYAAGACRTIYVGDSGELVTAAATLGIPHPSGYPLYVLVGKLWTLMVPAGSIAFRMSLFSAAGAAAACGVVYWLCRRLSLHAFVAATSALLLAFSPSFWGEANIQRVYALNALFVALGTAAAFAWHRVREPRALILAFFLCGLGATNHTFMAIFALALALFAVITAPALVKDWGTILRSGSAFAVGLLPYAYLPLRSRANPLLDWGNPETFDRFIGVVLRRDFWDRAFIRGPGDLPVIVWDYLRGVGVETAWVGALLALVGAVVGWRRRWPVLLPLLVMAGNLAALAIHGSRADIFIWHRYYIPSYMMAVVLAGMGAQSLCERLPRRVLPVLLVGPLVLLLAGWRDVDRSRYRIAEDFSRAVLSTLPPGAHLLASDDNILFVLLYLQSVEGARPDVDLILQGAGDTRLPPLRFNPDTDPLFLTHHPNWSVPGLEVAPMGLVLETVRAGGPVPLPPPIQETLDGETDARVPKDYLTQNLIGHFHYMRGLTFERSDWSRAWREFETAARAAPANDVLFYNLGQIYRRAGLIDEALSAFERSHAVNPRPIAGASRADSSDRVAEMRAERNRVEAVQRGFPGGPQPLSEQARAEWHRQLARWLEQRGEDAAARGHDLRALVLDAAGHPRSRDPRSR
jgi:tetratricopeptide (TPR) repeat protein